MKIKLQKVWKMEEIKRIEQKQIKEDNNSNIILNGNSITNSIKQENNNEEEKDNNKKEKNNSSFNGKGIGICEGILYQLYFNSIY